jgi:hypothetical protein
MISCQGRSFFTSVEVISRHFLGEEWREAMEMSKLGYSGYSVHINALFPFEISSYSTCWIKRRRDTYVT